MELDDGTEVAATNETHLKMSTKVGKARLSPSGTRIVCLHACVHEHVSTNSSKVDSQD